MNLTKLKIINFRGIQEIEINISDFTTIIGQNNAGKSSVLRAIDLLCNNGTPELEEIPNREYGLQMEIIGTFENIQDWERNTPGVSGLISENRIILRLSASFYKEGSKDKIERGLHVYKMIETISGWSETWSELDKEIKDLAIQVGVLNGTQFKTKANIEKVKQAIRDNRSDLIEFGKMEWTDEGISIPVALKQAMPATIVIPAVRDAAEEMKTGKTAKTAFGELINSLILPKVKELASYSAIIDALGELGAQIQNPEVLPTIQDINEKISNRLKGLIDVKSKLIMSNPDIDAALISNVGIRIVDGDHDTPINLQGHGLQRTLIYTLLEIIAGTEFREC
ncbi:MAG: AAA family ATPase [Flavobacteriales bacterium]|nr:AAA family ATPase [Flavobacteriales bacterium]